MGDYTLGFCEVASKDPTTLQTTTIDDYFARSSIGTRTRRGPRSIPTHFGRLVTHDGEPMPYSRMCSSAGCR